ncbi:hypothetical protein JL720_4358 [Aureococcus anophagefferens]|nr:hypothetical protein JL720_4358 [Aureococcus anophagefferens]
MAATVTDQRKAWMLDTILDKISERGGSMQVQIKLLLSKYDDDKSGELDMGEFRNALGDFLHGMDDAEFAALAETFDADGSGAVSIAEFEEALTKLAKDREEHGRQTSGGALTGVKTTHPPRPGTAGAPRKISDQARAAAEDAVVTQFFHQLRLRARTMANALDHFDVDESGLFDGASSEVVWRRCNDGEIKEILFKFSHGDAKRATKPPPKGTRAVTKLRNLLLDKFEGMGGNMRVAVKHTLGHYDADGSGELERGECVKALSGLLPGITDDQIGALFDTIDADKSETLTVDEITDFLINAQQSRESQDTSLAFADHRRGWTERAAAGEAGADDVGRPARAQLAQARSPEEYVDMLQHGVTHFPRTALFWRLYAEHERSLSGPASGLAVLEGGGSSALPWCRCDPELWRVACELRRDCGRREDELGPESKALGRAFERAVAVAGAAPDAAPLWRCYVDWCANAAPVSLRKKLRRSALERACLVPGDGTEEASGTPRATPTATSSASGASSSRTSAPAPKKSTATDLLPAETKAAALHYACGRRRVAAAYRAACDANAATRSCSWSSRRGAAKATTPFESPFDVDADGPSSRARPRGPRPPLERWRRPPPRRRRPCWSWRRARLSWTVWTAGEAEAALEALVDAAPLTDDPDAREGELDAAPWALLERHARRHGGKEAGRAVFARTQGLRASKKLSAKIYEAHAALELSMNGDVDAARRTFELGLSQRPELLLANDATYVLAYAAFLESAAGDAEAAAAVVERAVAAKGERDAPPALWDALASLAHRNATARNGAARRRRRQRAAAGKHAVGGALAPLWRDVASTRAAPLNAVDTAWRVREAVPATLPGSRDVRDARWLEARADGLLADEYDNGGLDADDLADDGGEGDGLFAALARGKLPEAFRRLADLAHRKAARGPAPPSKAVDVFTKRRAAAAKAVKVEK